MASEETQARTTTRLPARDNVSALASAGGDQDLADELLGELMTTLDDDIGAIRSAFGRQEWDMVVDRTNRLRGATAYCGVPALNQALEDLIQAGRAERLDELPGLLDEIEVERKRLQDDIANPQASDD